MDWEDDSDIKCMFCSSGGLEFSQHFLYQVVYNYNYSSHGSSGSPQASAFTHNTHICIHANPTGVHHYNWPHLHTSTHTDTDTDTCLHTLNKINFLNVEKRRRICWKEGRQGLPPYELLVREASGNQNYTDYKVP